MGSDLYFNARVDTYLRQDWNATIVCAAMRVDAHGGYAVHFHADTHKQGLQDKALKALSQSNDLAITEQGGANADVDGPSDKRQTDLWLAFARKNNLSLCNWALNDKKEGASQLKNGTQGDGKSLMATPNCSTYGHPNCPRQDGQIMVV